MSEPTHAVFHASAIDGLEDYAIYPFASKEEAEAWMIAIIRKNFAKEFAAVPEHEIIDDFQSCLDEMDYFHCYPIRKVPEVK